MIEALDNIFNGLASDETLFYGTEIKFYFNIIKVSSDFQTEYSNFYVAGDGAGITRSLIQANINDAIIGRSID